MIAHSLSCNLCKVNNGGVDYLIPRENQQIPSIGGGKHGTRLLSLVLQPLKKLSSTLLNAQPCRNVAFQWSCGWHCHQVDRRALQKGSNRQLILNISSTLAALLNVSPGMYEHNTWFESRGKMFSILLSPLANLMMTLHCKKKNKKQQSWIVFALIARIFLCVCLPPMSIMFSDLSSKSVYLYSNCCFSHMSIKSALGLVFSFWMADIWSFPEYQKSSIVTLG